MQHLGRATLMATLLVALSGCGGAADTLGLGRNAPDEFAVVDRPPLSLPPDFDLRPPRPGAPRPQEVKMQERASRTLFGANAKKSFAESGSSDSSASDSEKALLDSAGAAKADANIRETIDRESSQKVAGSRHLVDEVLWWRDPAGAAATVDAPAEAARIKEAKEKGASISEGATPIIEKSKSGWLGL